MAHFYVSTENSRGNQVTASGNKSGQTTYARGWDSGIRVRAYVDGGDTDVFEVYSTAGSNGGGRDVMVGKLVGGVWTACDGGLSLEEFQARSGY